jgi:methionyl-tRNA synthetase
MKGSIAERPWEEAGRWGVIAPGVDIGQAVVLFPRIEANQSPAPAEMAGQAKSSGESAAEQINIEQFREIDLRTGKIVSAERVQGATRLLKLQVDLGTEVRQVVAGIAEHYTAENLVGRNVVVVANLAPAHIKGIESRGMILAASSGDCLRLVSVDGEIAPGSKVK